MSKITASRFFLIRHGETGANREMRYLGSRNDPLTEHGATQAFQLAQCLAKFPITEIYSSPLCRAADTALQISLALRLPIRTDERLREEAFGDWEGLTLADIRARGPQHEKLHAMFESDPHYAPPNGESLASVQTRVVSLAQELAERHSGSNIALVSHVGPIKALLATALGAPLDTASRLFLDPATISVIDWGASPIVRLFNSHAHMGWQNPRWLDKLS